MEFNYINILISSILPTAVGTLFTLYISERVKGKVKNSFDNKLENQKKEHNLELSQFQAEINSLKSKENYKFTKLHEKRFDIMEVSYKLINEVAIRLNNYVNPVKNLSEKSFLENDNFLQQEFLNKHSEFSTYFSNHKYYFDSETKNLIDSYFKEVKEIYEMYYEKHFYGQIDEKPDREMMIKSVKAHKNIEIKISPIKQNIEKRFADILEN